MVPLIFLALLTIAIFIVAMKEQVLFEKMVKRDQERIRRNQRIHSLSDSHITVDQVLEEIMARDL